MRLCKSILVGGLPFLVDRIPILVDGAFGGWIRRAGEEIYGVQTLGIPSPRNPSTQTLTKPEVLSSESFPGALRQPCDCLGPKP